MQGVDYAYTIHGWLKGVNAGALNATRDMGGDGQGSNYRKNIGIDAFGFILDYYEGDYTQINSGTNSFIPAVGTSGFSDVTANLFNGNIRAMTTAIMQTTVTSNKHVIAPTLGKAYRYDQLNRLTESLSYEKSTMHQTGQFTWAGVSSTNKWATKYAYDANGNILSMLRAGNLGGAYDMDSLTYSYNSSNNQLQYVTDDVGDGVYTDIDVDNQDVDNYIYDEIGNMISDDQGEINAIAWNVYGKITSIDKVSGADLEFAYDATGNRISKKVIESGQPTKTTYYVRDAQGNVMAVYSRETTTGGSPTDTLFLSEQHIYGSSRLGYVQTKVKMSTTIPTSGFYSRVLGEKSYELSNHLGNVLAVVSDRRFAVEGSGATAGKIKYFEPDVLSSQDYDPFGMITVGRSWEVGSEYRYGFNTQEQDDEVYGNGNLNTAEFWTYDTRLGRRFNIDLVIKCNESGYATFANNPLIFIDFDGKDTARVDKSQNIEITEGGADALFIERKIKTFSSSELTSGRGIFDILSYMYVELGATTATLKDYSFSTNSDGSISIWKWTQIADLPGFRDYIGTVAGESSRNQNEAQGIGTIILKKLEKMGYSTVNVSYKSLNDLHNNVSKMYARDKTDINFGYPAITKKTFIEIFETQAFNLQLLGAIKALQVYGQEDITNGAYFWEGENTIFKTDNSFGKKDGNGVNIFKIVGKSGETYFMIYNPKSAPYATNTWR